LEKSNKRSDEERIGELKKELEAKRYNKNDDISMYISELSNIYSDWNLSKKPILMKRSSINYISHFHTIIIESHIIAYGTTWKEATEHLIKVTPHLKYLKELKTKQKQSSLNLSTEVPQSQNQESGERGLGTETAKSLATPRKKSVGQANYIQVSDDSAPGYEDAFREDYNDRVESSYAVTAVEGPRC